MKKSLRLLAVTALMAGTATAQVSITGTVYNDIDGQANNINNLSSYTAGGLNALLINSSGNVVQIANVTGTGAYTLTGVTAGTYTIRLSAGGTLSAAAPTQAPPGGYAFTGEGTTAAGDGVPDGDIILTVASAAIPNANFGIERTPESAVSVLGFQTNPGGTLKYTVPAAAFATSSVPASSPNTQDYDGGTVTSIRITAFPTSATSLTINGGTPYTSATFPAAGITVPVNPATNQPTQSIQIDPVDGNLTSILYFAAVDNAGKEDPTPGSVYIPFNGASTISGHVYNDANGNAAFDAGEGLNNVTVWLFNNAAGAPNYLVFPEDSVKTNASGAYTFSNVATGNYQVRIRFSTVPVTPVPTPRTVIDNNPYTADALANGLTNLVMTTGTTSYANLDFGLAANLAQPAFTSNARFSFNPTNTFNAGQNGQLTGTYNLATQAFGGSVYTPTITWKQDRNIQPPGYSNQYPQAAYSAGEFGQFFPGANKGGLHSGDTTYVVIAGDFGDYNVYTANNNRTTTSIKFSAPVINTKFSVYDVDNADPMRLGGRIDHVKVIGYRNGVAIMPVITNPSATPWNTVNGNTITGWPDYETTNFSFSYNSGNVDNAANNVYFAASIDSIAVEYEDYAPVLIGPKGALDGQQNSEAGWVARTPEGRGISLGSIDYKMLTLSGTVYNDVNGLTNGLIDGTATNAGGALYANLVNTLGMVVASAPVAADGTYLFNVEPGTYTVKLTTSATATGAALPAGYVNTGEGIIAGSNPASGDGAPNGSISVTVLDVNITGANFGIERAPESAVTVLGTQPNPGGTNAYSIPVSAFQASTAPAANPSTQDYDGGTVTNIRITAFPSNVTSLRIGTSAYYANAAAIPAVCPLASCLAFPAATGVTTSYTNGTGPVSAISVDPVDGNQTVVLPFAAIDNANGEDATPGSITIPFGVIALSGNVWDDANGNIIKDASENFVSGTNASSGGSVTTGGNLYANLVNAAGFVIGTTQVAANGSYTFPNVPSSTTGLSIQLSTVQGTVDAAQPATTLPSNWVTTGQSVTGGGNAAAQTGTPGIINLTTAASNITQQNFGIEQLSIADNKSYNVGSGGYSGTPPTGFPTVANYVSIPASSSSLTGYPAGGSLTGSDPEDCATAGSCSTGKTYSIESVAANTQLYYDYGGTTGIQPVTIGAGIPNFDPSKLVIYGQKGSGTAANPVSFTYKLIDAAGKKGAAATYSITSGNPLMVTLAYFNGQCTGENVVLDWQSGVESNISAYDVEVSDGAETWKKIANIPAAGAGRAYQSKVAAGAGSLYRLSYVSLSGTPQFSATLSISCGSKTQVESLSLYPNPNAGIFNIGFMANEDRNVRINVINAEGRSVYLLTTAVKTGSNSIPCDLSQLPAGIYYVALTDEKGNRSTVAFEKDK